MDGWIYGDVRGCWMWKVGSDKLRYGKGEGECGSFDLDRLGFSVIWRCVWEPHRLLIP